MDLECTVSHTALRYGEDNRPVSVAGLCFSYRSQPANTTNMSVFYYSDCVHYFMILIFLSQGEAPKKILITLGRVLLF